MPSEIPRLLEVSQIVSSQMLPKAKNWEVSESDTSSIILKYLAIPAGFEPATLRVEI
jgi:hypothetical protein